MADTTIDQIRQLVADTFGIDVSSVTAETSPETVEAWESMSHLSLMLSLESQFGISIEPDEMPTLVSVQAIADKVEASSA